MNKEEQKKANEFVLWPRTSSKLKKFKGYDNQKKLGKSESNKSLNEAVENLRAQYRNMRRNPSYNKAKVHKVSDPDIRRLVKNYPPSIKINIDSTDNLRNSGNNSNQANKRNSRLLLSSDQLDRRKVSASQVNF